MIKKFSILTIFGALGLLSVAAAKPQVGQQPPVTVGILAPVAIPAMAEIINGFKTELTRSYPGKVNYVVENAQGNINIQRSILQEFKAKNVNIVAPIGTAATQMSMAMMTKQPVVALAAEVTNQARATFPNKNMTNILDEVNPAQQLKFIHAALPRLKNIALVYSSDDRIFDEVKQFNAAAKADGIATQKLMMQQMSDLYSISKQLKPNTQAIFIFKDEPVVAGIATLVQQAESKHIPVIASDDGSVEKGAAFAVGVSERKIGVGGAKLAAKVLAGTPASQVPVRLMTKYSVFVNKASMQKQGVSLAQISKTAKQFKYPVVFLSSRT